MPQGLSAVMGRPDRRLASSRCSRQITSHRPQQELLCSNLFTPAAMLRLFQDLTAAETEGIATPDLLQEIAQRSQRRC
jgi:hypothetical protein